MTFVSLTVDTACSSSLYALHLACQSLLAGDCTAAVVGGSNLVTGVDNLLGSESLGVLSPSSTCHTFDASADGFGKGDGIAVLYIKRLSDAKSDGDPIRAIIRATSINS
jgi:acyl transferase domain-containing protein